ncbi:MAG TPA: MFS transporter [Oligoflexus sp.]|uniref:MFS transporter n=1 Tax=Oligoflexus sp. TaxID=1971216 RepID=UPI002D4E3F79|nr:MFS transporter [Oligoflexus sp.]HYX34914.1 MFS transporter [Oligoflexus sp.]
MSLSKSSITLLSLVFLSQAFSFAVTLLPNLLAGTGLFSPVQAGLVLALASLMSGFWQPLVGRWLDEGRYRTAFAIIASAYALGIAAFLSGAASPSIIILGALALVVAMTTLRTLQSLAIVGRFQGEERAHMAGVRYLVSNFALGVAATIAFQWLTTHRTLLLSIDLVTTLILGTGLTWFLLRERRKQSTSVISSAGSLSVLRGAFHKHGIPIAGICLITIGFMGQVTYLPLQLTKRGLPAVEWNALVLVVNTATIVLGMRFLRRLLTNWSDQQRGAAGAGLIALGLALVPLVSSPGALVAVTLVWTVGEMIFIPWEQVKLYEFFGDAQPGLASGAITFVMTICQVLAPLFATILLMVPEAVASGLLLVLPLGGFALYRWGPLWTRPAQVSAAEKEAA